MNIERSQVRKISLLKLKKARMWFAISTGIPLSGTFCVNRSHFFNQLIINELTINLLYVSCLRCKIVDKHLSVLAKKHLETKFITLNVEKAPFLTERLRIKVIPTLALVKDGKTKDYVVGFTDLGNTDEFTTEMLEWRLGCSDIINYR